MIPTIVIVIVWLGFLLNHHPHPHTDLSLHVVRWATCAVDQGLLPCLRLEQQPDVWRLRP